MARLNGTEQPGLREVSLSIVGGLELGELKGPLHSIIL